MLREYVSSGLPLYGEGPRTARIAVVGQSPGREEERMKRPFVGSSGKLLRNVLRTVGFDAGDVYMTNVYKRIVPNDDWNRVDQEFLEKVCIPVLKEELMGLTHLKIVIPLGAPALKALCGVEGIDKWRGSIIPLKLIDLPHVKCIPTYNPAAVLRMYSLKPIFRFDLEKAHEELLVEGFNYPQYNFVHPTSAEEIVSWLESHEGCLCAVDTETIQNPLEITCMSIAVDGTNALSIPFYNPMLGYVWSLSDMALIIKALDSFLSRARLIIQNSMFDLFVFRWLGYSVKVEQLWMDTMLAHHLLWSELPHGLDFLCSIYTRQPYYKDEGKTWHPTFSWLQYLEYNLRDSCVAYTIAMELDKELQKAGLWPFYEQYYLKLIPPLLDASLRGIRVDRHIQDQIRKEYKDALNNKLAQIESLCGKKINVHSLKDMKWLIYEYLKLPKRINPKTGRPTIDEETLHRYAYNYHNPIFDLIIDARRIRKVLSTYIDIPTDDDNRIRCAFNLMGTVTGRLSSGPCPTGSGQTIHNLPRKGVGNLKPVKTMLVADDGYLFVVADYKQAETWIVAALAEEELLMKLLLSGVDVHRWVAANLIFNVHESQVTSDQRYLAKRTGHAANYGMGPRKLQSVLVDDKIFLSEGDCRKMLDAYHNGFPNIRKVFHRRIEEELYAKRSLISPNGRPRTFLGRLDPDTFREAYAHIPQGYVSDLLNQALIAISQRYEIVGQQHDSVWVHVKSESIVDAVKYIERCMRKEVHIGNYDFTIPVEIKFGRNLGEMEDWSNEKVQRGLVESIS